MTKEGEEAHKKAVSNWILTRLWAGHVDEKRHVSHHQNGQPFFELSRDARSIRCTAPGCPWHAAMKAKGGK